jgi:hypothetical protein
LEAVSASDFDEAAKRIAEQAPPPPKPHRRRSEAIKRRQSMQNSSTAYACLQFAGWVKQASQCRREVINPQARDCGSEELPGTETV